jgi:hypothetical protein
LRLILIGFAASLFTVVTFAVSQGATFTVTNSSDSAGVGSGSLRRAILDANAAAGPDVIVFAARLVGQTLTLTGGELDITDDLTINGPGATRLTVNGSGRDIFRIRVSRIAVVLDGLTLENGDKVIEITGSRNTVMVAAATLIGNGSDDGIRIDGDFNWVSIVDVVLVGHEDNLQVGSSGVCSATTDRTCVVNAGCPMGETCINVLGHNNFIDVADSTIRRASQDGVAINGSGNTVTVQDSTISENGLHPTDPNDGLDVNGAGNALWILQVTVSGNGEHGVDIEGPDNQVVLENSTLTNNDSDGVIIQDHINRANTRITVFVQHNIIAGNRGARSSATVGGADVFDPFGSNNFISGGYNLVGNATGSRGFDGPGDQAGTATNPIDARLGPLADNGGPTLTHALRPGSSAINAGDPHFTPPPEFDQRGPGFPQPRVQDGRIDIGAVELGAIPQEISFQDGVSPTPAYAGTRDTYLSEDQPTTNFCGLPTLRVDGDDPPGTGRDLRTLLLWDLSAIPAGSKVTSATITINVTNATNGTYELYRIASPWDECQVTWNTRPSRGMTVRGTVGPAPTGTHTVTLNPDGVALVQSWVDDPTMNHGIMIVDSDIIDGLAFNSREASPASNRPRLTITFD